jgi:hypothetical protein
LLELVATVMAMAMAMATMELVMPVPKVTLMPVKMDTTTQMPTALVAIATAETVMVTAETAAVIAVVVVLAALLAVALVVALVVAHHQADLDRLRREVHLLVVLAAARQEVKVMADQATVATDQMVHASHKT